MIDYLRHFLMPFIALFLSFLPDATRYVRSSTITQYSEDYVMVQQAFGASKAEIMFKHVCKNVLLPIITKARHGIADACNRCDHYRDNFPDGRVLVRIS